MTVCMVVGFDLMPFSCSIQAHRTRGKLIDLGRHCKTRDKEEIYFWGPVIHVKVLVSCRKIYFAYHGVSDKAALHPSVLTSLANSLVDKRIFHSACFNMFSIVRTKEKQICVGSRNSKIFCYKNVNSCQMVTLKSIKFTIDWFQRHVNPSRIIFWLWVRKLLSNRILIIFKHLFDQ